MTKDDIFKPEKLSPQAKAEVTTAVAKDILAKEVSARQKKTEKLRALRLERAGTEAPPKPTKRTKKR
jgi:hypothetical protein